MKREYIVSIDFIGDAPSNKEIVRCKDCKLRGDIACPMVVNKEGLLEDYATDDWFCADGEKK